MSFHSVVLVKTFPLMFQSPLKKTDIDDARVISFVEERTDGRTDRQKRFNNSHMEICRYTKKLGQRSKLGVRCRALCATPMTGMHKEAILEKICHERYVNESVEEMSLSWATSRKLTE